MVNKLRGVLNRRHKLAVRGLTCLSLVPTLFFGVVAAEEKWLMWNQPAVRTKCPETEGYLWVTQGEVESCIRYFPGDSLEGRTIVIVQFYGDRDRVMSQLPSVIKNNTEDAQRHYAAMQSRRAGVPVVIVARPGTYGSSGNHGRRRQKEEYIALNAALDSLSNRYGIHFFTLLGHSGGATAAAAILTMGRRDIPCLSLSSGAFDLTNRAEAVRAHRGASSVSGRDLTGFESPYDPLHYVESVVHQTDREIALFGDPRDQITPFKFQEKFATALREAGHNVILKEAAAQAPSFHNLLDSTGLREAARCTKSWLGQLPGAGSEVG